MSVESVLTGWASIADLAGAGPATPEHLEAAAVPGEYSLGSDEDERADPIRPDPAEGDPEHAIARPEPSALRDSQVDGELLAQGRVLQGQGGPGHQGCPEAGE